MTPKENHVVINKKAKFALRIAKNIAELPTEEERAAALAAVHPDSLQLIEAAVTAILRNRE